MSAEAIGWVFRRSPYSGDSLVIHLAIADVVNDMYDNRFWMKVPELASKSKCDDRTVQRALRSMEVDGMIKRLKAGGGRGRPAEYEMLFPEPDSMEHHEKKGDTVTPIAGETVTSGAGNGDIHDIAPSVSKSIQVSVGEPPTMDAIRLGRAGYPVEFDAAWSAYPRKSGKRSTYRAWRARVMDAPKQGVSRDRRMVTMLVATKNFAAAMTDEGREQSYIMQGERFFGPNEPWREFYKRVPVDDRPDAPWSSSRANNG